MSRLSNSDFRTMMMTPRSDGAAVQMGAAARPKTSQPQTPRSSDKPRRAKPEFKAPQPKILTEEEREQQEALKKYRDRAAERRTDANPDYEAMPERELTVEETKFLGGDMEHTHLVKGLDFALLKKVRSDMVNQVKETSEVEELEKQYECRLDDEILKAPAAQDTVSVQTAAAEARSALAKKIMHALFIEPKERPKRVEMFLPRRMAYVYEMGDSVEEIPTTVMRSKADCPPPSDLMSGRVGEEILAKIEKTLSFYTHSRHGHRKKKLVDDSMDDLMPAPASAKKRGADADMTDAKPEPVKKPSEPAKPKRPVDFDDNIFPDAGVDYKPPPKPVSSAPNLPDIFAPSTGEADMEIEEPGQLKPTEEKPDMYKYFPASAQPPPLQQPMAAPTMPMMPQPPSGMDMFAQQQQYMYMQQMAAQAALAQQQQMAQQQITNAQKNVSMAYSGLSLTEQQERDRGLTTIFKSDVNKARPKPNFGAGGKTQVGEDAYAECYPSTYGEVAEIDSAEEDEADLDKMDMGRQGGKYVFVTWLRRWDFETEEEWSAYNASREAIPKMAFQFGIKMKDGRKSNKQTQKKEQKFNSTLKKIERLVENKRKRDDDGGGDHSGKKQE